VQDQFVFRQIVVQIAYGSSAVPSSSSPAKDSCASVALVFNPSFLADLVDRHASTCAA
jgi:hypothetical protein